MKTMHILIFGLDEDVKLFIKAFQINQTNLTWTVITNKPMSSSQQDFLDEQNISLSFNLQEVKDVDVILHNNENVSALSKLVNNTDNKPFVIPKEFYNFIVGLLRETYGNKDYEQEVNELILETIHDGMIIVDRHERVRFVNQRARDIMDIQEGNVSGRHIQTIIPDSRLPRVMQSGQKEINCQLKLKNGRKVVSTRTPMIDRKGEIVGAFAIFKDITEVVRLAEENTDLNRVKMMLEAIIFSSLDAISVVDEEGKGIMINPAYTNITGLSEEQVIGKPATTDIYEGTSVHDYVLSTGENVRNATMKVGLHKTDVIVNAAPILVDDNIAGSVAVIHDVSELQKLSLQLQKAQKEIRALQAQYTFSDIIGDSTEMMIAREQGKIGARTPATVLLRGESGSGKELFAHAIHNESDRKSGPFIRVNCASIPPHQMERALFGYVEDDFSKGKEGIFEQGNKGSVFLDEITELPQDVQIKILQMLKEKEIVRVGGKHQISIDVRIIAATNQHLEKEVSAGKFREDLYYYLNRLPIFIPPLRERVEDIPMIAEHLIEKMNVEYSRDVKGMTEEAIQFLQQLSWNGNIRELENRIGRAMIYMSYDELMIAEHHLKEGWMPPIELDPINAKNSSGDRLKDAVEDFEKEFISRVYRSNKFVKTKTAEDLGISLRSLYNKLEKFGIT